MNPVNMTSIGDLSPKIQAYYDMKFLITLKSLLGYHQHGQKRVLPKNESKTIVFTRFKPLEKRVDEITETDDGGLTTRKKFETVEIRATPKRYGDIARTSYITELTAFNEALAERFGIMGMQACETIEELVKKTVGCGLIRRRTDADSAYQKDSIATDGTTNTLVDTTLTQIDNYWNGAYVTFTNPLDNNYGLTVQIATSTNKGVLTFSKTLPCAPKAQVSKYRIVSSTGVVPQDKLTCETIKLAIRDLKINKALPMPDGNYVCLVDPYIECDFMGDKDWLDVSKYNNSKAIYNGEIGKIWKTRFVQLSEVYRETCNGNYDPDGQVHVATLLGREAYGVVDFESKSKKIYTKSWEQLAQTIPLYSEIGWDIMFTTTILNANFGVNLLCGASC